MLLQENQKLGIDWSLTEQDKLASLLKKRYTYSNKEQLAIKDACPAWNNPQNAKLNSNYLVSNGLKHLAQGLNLPAARDQVRMWKKGF